MKIFSFLLMMSFTINGFSSKIYFTEINIRSILSSQDNLQNCSVTVIDEAGIEVSQITDKKGIVRFEKLKSKEIHIKVDDPSGFHLTKHYWQYNSKREYIQLTLFLYPSREYEKNILAKEDSLYGTDDSNLTMFEEYGNKLENHFFCDSAYSILPQFGNGDFNNLSRFISENVMYPWESIEMNEQGKVFLTFILEKDGTVTHVKIVKGVSQAIDYEAIRVLRSMPKWIPGKCHDEAIRTKMYLPINFNLQ